MIEVPAIDQLVVIAERGGEAGGPARVRHENREAGQKGSFGGRQS
jgi:hypothetical protein